MGGHSRERHAAEARRRTLICSIPSPRCPRWCWSATWSIPSPSSATTAIRATSRAKPRCIWPSTGIADTAYFGAEAEFFIFDNVRFDQREQYGFYYIDAEEGRWNSGREANNLGYRPRYREGYFPVPPTDHYQDLRSEMVLTMQSCGIDVECHHHEVATGGQTEIDLKFDSLLRSADKMLLYKYIVKNVANRHGKTVTFMPKPIFGDNGSGMHTHQSLWKAGEPLFAGDGYAGLSQLALWYVGGLHQARPGAFGDHRADDEFL